MVSALASEIGFRGGKPQGALFEAGRVCEWFWVTVRNGRLPGWEDKKKKKRRGVDFQPCLLPGFLDSAGEALKEASERAKR